jgi:surface antigen
MKRFAQIAICALVLGLLAGQAQAFDIDKGDIGTVLGGVAGGVLGAQIGSGAGKTVATIAGVLVGAGVGRYIGKSMDESDRVKTARALETSRDNQSSSWKNPNTGGKYSVKPTKTYQQADGEYCRDFTQKVTIEGKQETATGTACRRNGRWEIVSSQ